MMKRALFGTDGIRGRANRYPMTTEVATALGRAVTYFFQKNHSSPIVIIGKDTRRSCYMLEQAIAAGVCAQGGQAIFTGPLPTPAIAFITQSMRASAGIMISASHNPYYDNGIKIFDGRGHKLNDQTELEIENLIFNQGLISEKIDEQIGSASRLDEVIGRYIVYVKSCLDSQVDLSGLKVVMDCAHGAAYKVAPKIFQELGINVIPLGISPNGVNINLERGAMHPQVCAQAVIDHQADIGFCFDGDGDRLIVIDEKGKVLEGDQLIGLLATKSGLGSRGVVGTILSNYALEDYLQKKQISFYRTEVGDRYIAHKMRELGAYLGGEPSGHLILSQYSTTGDGILSALKLLQIFMESGESKISQLAQGFIPYPVVQKNLHYTKKQDYRDSRKFMTTLLELEKKIEGQGRIVLRYSGTEPVLRIMVEGQCEQQIEEIAQILYQKLHDEFV